LCSIECRAWDHETNEGEKVMSYLKSKSICHCFFTGKQGQSDIPPLSLWPLLWDLLPPTSYTTSYRSERDSSTRLPKQQWYQGDEGTWENRGRHLRRQSRKLYKPGVATSNPGNVSHMTTWASDSRASRPLATNGWCLLAPGTYL